MNSLVGRPAAETFTHIRIESEDVNRVSLAQPVLVCLYVSIGFHTGTLDYNKETTLERADF